jgi:hypothetical protein
LELWLNPYVNEENPDAIENKTRLTFSITGDHQEVYGYVRSYEQANMDNPEVYDALCEKYGDMSYNREEFVPVGSFPGFLAYSPVSIEIVSDADFDEDHLAGASLANLVIYDGQSSKPFVDNGYQMYHWEDSELYPSGHKNMDKFPYHSNVSVRPYFPVYKKVSELTAYDLMLIYGSNEMVYGYLYFPVPTLSKRHNITVTFTDERGRVFSDTIAMNFE